MGQHARIGELNTCKKGHTYVIKGTGCPECRSIRTKIWREKHPEHTANIKAAWHKRNPEKKKAARIKYNYGLSFEEFNCMKEKQNNICLVCKTNKAKVIDHNHTTNKVRGLLCYPCNNLLGMAKDNIETLLSAIEYLKKGN